MRNYHCTIKAIQLRYKTKKMKNKLNKIIFLSSSVMTVFTMIAAVNINPSIMVVSFAFFLVTICTKNN